MYVWNFYVWVLGLPVLTFLTGTYLLRRVKYEVESSEPLLEIAPGPNRLSKSASFLFWSVTATLLFGPPWSITGRPLSLNNHETVHLKGLQAIFSGAQEYVGSASSQYGPLNQVAASLYMKYISSETLAGNREYWAAINFVGLAVILLVVVFVFSPRTAFVINGFLLVWPAFNFYALKPDGLDGFFGWPNPLRYLSALIIPIALVRRRSTTETTRGQARMVAAGIALGLLWLFSQENLLLSIPLIPLVGIIQIAQGKEHFRQAIRNILTLVATALLVMSAYLVPYVLSGELKSFLHNYFLIPRAVLSGYANFEYQLTNNPCCNQNQQYLPFFIWIVLITGLAGLLIAYLLLLGYRNVNSQNHNYIVRLFSLWAGSATILSGAFASMGSTRVIATSIILPIWLVGLCVLCCSPSAKSWKKVLGGAVLILTLLLNSNARFGRLTSTLGYENISKTVEVRLRGFSEKEASPNLPPFVYSADFSRQNYERFIGWLTRMSRQTTYIDPLISPAVGDELGIYYFVADLVPYPVPFDEQTMVITIKEEKSNLKALSDPRNQLCNLVTSDLTSSTVDAARKFRNFRLSGSINVNGQEIFRLQNRSCGVTG